MMAGQRVSRRRVLGGAVCGAAVAGGVPAAGAAPPHSGAPTPEFPRRVALQLSAADATTVNNLLFNVVNVQKRYGLDNVKVAVVAYAEGVRALYRDSAPVPERIESLLQYGVEFIACGSTLEAQKRVPGDLIAGITVVPSAIPELIERQLDGWVVLHP